MGFQTVEIQEEILSILCDARASIDKCAEMLQEKNEDLEGINDLQELMQKVTHNYWENLLRRRELGSTPMSILGNINHS